MPVGRNFRPVISDYSASDALPADFFNSVRIRSITEKKKNLLADFYSTLGEISRPRKIDEVGTQIDGAHRALQKIGQIPPALSGEDHRRYIDAHKKFLGEYGHALTQKQVEALLEGIRERLKLIDLEKEKDSELRSRLNDRPPMGPAEEAESADYDAFEIQQLRSAGLAGRYSPATGKMKTAVPGKNYPIEDKEIYPDTQIDGPKRVEQDKEEPTEWPETEKLGVENVKGEGTIKSIKPVAESKFGSKMARSFLFSCRFCDWD